MLKKKTTTTNSNVFKLMIIADKIILEIIKFINELSVNIKKKQSNV